MNELILVVDDDKSIVRVVKGYLEQANYTVLTAFDGATALHILRSEKPDLLILDLMLPDQDGWEITRILRADKTLATIPIIMLTARVEDTDMIVGLELGADDYITKPFNGGGLVARVRSLLRRSKFGQTSEFVPSKILRSGDLVLDIDKRTLTVNTMPVDLTRTEFKLLHVFMANPDHTLARDELLAKGLGYSYTGMGRALDTHILNLRKKIEPDPDNPRYIQTVYGIGYRFIDEDVDPTSDK
ncbi:MAG: response regulator transcription factor [Chloroflexota bacterium]